MMVRVVCLIIAVVVCFSVISTASNCEYGEAIICRDYESAKSCGKLERCSDLWRRANILAKSPSVGYCHVCQHFLVNKMHDNLSYLFSKSTKNTVFSSKDVKNLYANVTDADFTCTLMKMCNTTFTLPTLQFNRSDVCDDCKHIIDDVRILIEDQATKTAVATYLKVAFCIRLPLQIVDICKHTIDSYLGVFMDLVASKLESQKTCAFFGLCPNTVSIKPDTKFPKTQFYSWIRRPSNRGYAMWHSRLSLKNDSQNCTDCVKVFSRIRDVSKDKSFDERFKAIIVDRICRKFGVLKHLCANIISNQVDELIDESSKANLKDICIFFEQCQGTLSPSTQKLIDGVDTLFSTSSKKDVGFPVICEFCEALMKKILDATINNRTEAAIMAALKAMCNWFPEPECTNCRKYIDEYGQWIVDAIISGTAPKVVCMGMGLCLPWDRHVASPQGLFPISMGANRAPCLICNALTNLVYTKLHQNSTVAMIEKDLESFCIYAPSAEDLCRKQVKKFTPIVIELFINGVPKSEVCKIVKLCSDEPDNDVPKPVSEGCDVCEIVIGFIKSKIEANDTIDIIEKKLETVCNYIPYAGYKEKCHEYVRAYSKDLIKYLVDNVSTRGICEKLGFCSGIAKAGVAIADEQVCTICTEIFQYIYTEISDKNTEVEITQVLEYVCHVLPSGLQARCHSIVEQYTPQLIAFLVNKVPPKKICQELGLCSPVEPQDKLTCTVCTEIIQYIYSEIKDKNTEDAIRRALESVCDSIPIYKDQCQYYVKEYTDKLIQMLMDKLTPEEVCQKFGFCPLATRVGVPLSNNQGCTICVEIIDYIETKITDNRTEDEIEALLESVCDYIPWYKEECHAMAKEHFKELIEMLMKRLSPKKICQELGACESDKHIEFLCRGSASAWCRDTRSAELCNKTVFCREFFWHPQSTPKKITLSPVQLYDCNKLINLVERCKQEHVAKLCGLSTAECAPLRAFGENRQDPLCSFCRKVLGTRIVSGAVGLNCSIYVTAREKEHCEKLRKLPLPGRLSWEKLDSVCKAENMCDNQLDENKPKWIIGDDPCLWGSSVVCQSMDNAERCGQLEFCRSQVWNGPTPPLRRSKFQENGPKKTPGVQLVDCELPLDKLCGSPNVRFCGDGVHRRCFDFINSRIALESQSKMDKKMKSFDCLRSRYTLCSDRKLMEQCGVERYCEAMGLTPSTPAAEPELPKGCFIGPSFYCQSFANAKLCKKVALCRAEHWL